jgi:hypothetical protein
MTNGIEAVVEILSWAGFGLGGMLAVAALIVFLADGTWLPVRGFVEHEGDQIIVRWFDEDDQVNQAPLSPGEWEQLGGKDAVDVYARRGSRDRMRATRRSPVVRGLALLAALVLGVGLACSVISLVLLFMAG